MTAVGGPGAREVVDLSKPEISSERDVLVRLGDAGINPVDYNPRQVADAA
jgi:NADPH:quinone reductase-like Zn-dependent oxidoreductase